KAHDPGLRIEELEGRGLQKGNRSRACARARGSGAQHAYAEGEEVDRADPSQGRLQVGPVAEDRSQARADRQQLHRAAAADSQHMRDRTAESERRAGGGQHDIVGSRGDRHDEGIGREGKRVNHGALRATTSFGSEARWRAQLQCRQTRTAGTDTSTARALYWWGTGTAVGLGPFAPEPAASVRPAVPIAMAATGSRAAPRRPAEPADTARSARAAKRGKPAC